MPRNIPHTSVIYKKLRRLNTPQKIQDFLNKLPYNHERRGETYMSVERTLEARTAHCFEGALVAAAALWIQGEKPLLLDLRTIWPDFDHVVCIYKKFGKWGAIGKTNHAVLRYREPIYASVRELALSYFHEYFLNNGKKTLREFSKPFDLRKTKIDWLYGKEELYDLVDELDHAPHIKILDKKQIKNLRKADKIEIKAGEIVEWQ